MRQVLLSILYFLLCFFHVLCPAQTYSISGSIVDSKGNRVEGVYVTCQQHEKTLGCKSDSTGHFKISNIIVDSVVLRFSHINYKDTVVPLMKKNYSKPLSIIMLSKINNLEAVKITTESLNSNLRGDTTVYFAKAYKINKDASAYDLIQKLPGVGLSDGTLQAHGETVTEVLIDGREYNDITMALKNIPAYIVNEVQIFYKGSDYSRITGFDDGERNMVLNLSTRRPNAKKMLGKVQAAYGSSNRYDCYGNLNWFNSTNRLSIFAQLNNVNRQDYSGFNIPNQNNENTPGQSPYTKGRSNILADNETNNGNISLTDGQTATAATALNHSFSSKDSSFSIVSHYFYSITDNATEYNIDDYFFIDSTQENQKQLLTTTSHGQRFKTKIEWRITKKDVVVFSPEISFQETDKNENISLSRNNTLTPIDQAGNNSEKNVLARGQLNYVHHIGKKGSAVSLTLNGRYLDGECLENIDITQLFSSINRNVSVHNKDKQTEGTLSFATPSINRYSRLKFDIFFNVNKLNGSRKSLLSDTVGNVHVDTMSSGRLSVLDYALAGRMVYTYSRRKTNVVCGSEVFGQNHSIATMMVQKDTNTIMILPFFQLRYQINSKNQIHFNIATKQQKPTAGMYDDVVRVVNPTLHIYGNPHLDYGLSNDISIRWLHNDVARSRFFVLFAKYGRIENTFATVRALDVKEGNDVQIVSYRNSSIPQKSIEALVAYGFPFKTIKSNVNLSSYCRYSFVPGFYNDTPSNSDVLCWNNSITIGSNISEHIDFVIDVNASYNSDKNNDYSLFSASYWSYSFGGQLVTHLGKHIKSTIECGYTGYTGNWVYNYNALISNISFSALFGKNQCFEFQLAVNDIFNQNNNFYQSITELYLRETDASVLKRYLLLKLLYNINNSNNEN